MSASAGVLITRRERGWRIGLGNMLAKEVASWWRTRRWWVQSLVALVLLNATLALNSRGIGVQGATETFMMTLALGVPLAAVIVAQDSILNEGQSGTAEWVLSKPLRRPAFILAKLAAHGLGLLVTWAVLPCTIAYFQFAAHGGQALPLLGYLEAMALHYLNLFFYLALALMLATLFHSRGPVLGISVLVAWSGPMQFIAQPIEKYAPWLPKVLPWNLLMPLGKNMPLAGYLAEGAPLPTVVPIIATVLWCVLFVGAAVWRFRREEF